MYFIMRGNTICGIFGNILYNGKKVWRAAVNFGNECYLIDDIYLGMNLDELKDITSRSMKNSKVNFVKNEGVYKVYEVTWIGNMNLDEPYGRFWFNAKGQLVKWYQWREGSNF